MATAKQARKKAEEYHGVCQYDRLMPGKESVSLFLGFDDALRLSVAIQSAILELNRYNRATKQGKRMGLCISVRTKNRSVSVWHGRLRDAKNKAGRNGEADQ